MELAHHRIQVRFTGSFTCFEYNTVDAVFSLSNENKLAELHKRLKYAKLIQSYSFLLLVVKPLGSTGKTLYKRDFRASS